MVSTRSGGADKAKVRNKRSHKTTTVTDASHQTSRASKVSTYPNASRGRVLHESRRRHKRSSSHESVESGSDEDENEHEPIEDHRAILAAARGKITSPSVFSISTSMTTATNNSGGSSGSNSTITEASVARQLEAKRATLAENPLSPAVPDPPDVFAYMIEDDSPPDEDDEGEDDEIDDEDSGDEEETADAVSTANRQCVAPEEVSISNVDEDQLNPIWHSNTHSTENDTHSASSSASSSFHGDSASESHGGNDTDRSTSPEPSNKGSSPPSPRPTSALPADEPPPSPAAMKFAAHEKAARRRQNLSSSQHYVPNSHTRPVPAQYPTQYPAHRPPYVSTALSITRGPHVQAPTPADARTTTDTEEPRAGGYNFLASALTASSPSVVSIPPLYRKFTNLSHRYLLQLQDELAEHEEQLAQLDRYHVQVPDPQTGKMKIVPGCRRRNWDIDHHRAELLHLAGHKLKLYQDALKGHENIEGSSGLRHAKEGHIEKYREFLERERPVVDEETRFLDHKEDLVVVGHKHSQRPKEKKVTFEKAAAPTSPSSSSLPAPLPSNLAGLAVTIAAAVLIPIVTFVVIPGFLGRMTVVLLVASGIVGAVFQAGAVSIDLLGREGLVCASVYGVGMALLACVV